jgi:hypothetical protein
MRFSSVFVVSALVALSGCSLKRGGSSSVTLKFPSAEQLKSKTSSAQKISASNLDWSKACFMVNVTGPGLDSAPKTKCDVPVGVFGGSVETSGTIELKVDKGSQRKVEVFAYFRSSTSETCLKKDSLNQFDPGSVASVGSTVVDFNDDTEIVDVEIGLPNVNDNLVSEFSLPGFCASGAVAAGDGSSRILTARASASTASFKVESVVTGLPTGPSHHLTSGITVRFSHQAKDKDLR